MKKNMSSADRIIRILLAAVISILYFTHAVTGTFGIIALVIAGIFIITGIVGTCPLYALIGITTQKKKTI